MRIELFSPGHGKEWDEFVGSSLNGTFLHTRRFMAHHGSKFEDRSVLLRSESGALVGVLPAAVDCEEHSKYVSHPGLTYGGIVHRGRLHGERALEALSDIAAFYREMGATVFSYGAIPWIYHLSPCEDDLYALYRLGASLCGVGLSSVVDIALSGRWSQRRLRGLTKSRKFGVQVSSDPSRVGPFWSLLESVLQVRHDVKPVHTETEIRRLMALFPEEIELVIAEVDSELVAGTLLFHSQRVSHAQYIASGSQGRELGALEAVFQYCIERARQSGGRFFDFGVSTESGGRRLNAGLEQFKHEFGSGSVGYMKLELKL